MTKDDVHKLYHCMELIEAKARLHFNQHSGLSECFSESTRRKMLDLLHQLAQEIQTHKACLRELGLEAFVNITGALLGLERQSSAVADGQGPHKFLEFASLWSQMDYAYANLSIYLPPRAYSDKKKMDDLEHMLSQQVAASAHIEPQLVDLLAIACDPAEEKTGMHGKAVIRLLGHATGLEVTVLAGKYWPCADASNTATPVVGVKLGVGRRKSKESKGALVKGRLARKMLELQQFTAVRPGKKNMVNPKFENEKIELMIYAPDQMLVVTAYEHDKGIQTGIGEVSLKVDEIVSECRKSPGLQFSRSYGLEKNLGKPVFYKVNREDKSANRQSEIILEFRAFTCATKLATAKMAESVMKEANKPDSALCAGCIVTGPAFQDEGAAWETLRIYVCSDYFEMQPEREYLERYVFPALAHQCQTLKLHFKWIDMSAYGRDGTRDDIMKRIHAINQSKIRSYDAKGALKESHLVLCLVGEKRGRLLDERDIRRARAAEATPGMYDWVVNGANKGMSVLELEMKAAIFNKIDRSDAIICIRNSAFLNDEKLIATVPKAVRARFMEPDIIHKAKMKDLKDAVCSKLPSKIIRYKPDFSHFIPAETGDTKSDSQNSTPRGLSVFESTNGDGDEPSAGGDADQRMDETQPQAGDGTLCLRSLERFGLSVYERIWDIICRRYSHSRSRTRINLYGEEVQSQAEHIKAFYKAQHQVSGGTQETVVNTLHDFADFANIDSGDTLYLMGLHGCGMSTLLSRFIVEKNLIDVHEAFDEAPAERVGLKRHVQKVININRMTSRKSMDTSESAEDDASIWQNTFAKIRKVVAVTLLFKTKSRNTDTVDGEQGQEGDAQGEEADITTPISHLNVGYDENEDESVEKVVNQKISSLPTSSKQEQAMLANLLSSVQALMARKVPMEEISFRIMQPRCIFFFKREMHSTSHMLSHLCSSLLRQNDSMAPSWRRLEQLLRQITSPTELSGKDPNPVLLVLDGLNNDERQEIRRIVVSFQGRLRAIISVDKLALHNDDHSAYEGLRKSVATVNVPPLGHAERKEIFDALINRTSPKKKPENLNVITDRQAAGSPLYLQTVAAYFAGAIVLSRNPQPMVSLNNTVVDVIGQDFLPMLEGRVGEEYVRVFAEIMIFSPCGNESKDIHAMMQSFGAPLVESNFRLLMDAFRPFADTVSTMSEDHISMTRSSLRIACQRRYTVSMYALQIGNRKLLYVSALIPALLRIQYISYFLAHRWTELGLQCTKSSAAR